MQKRTIILGLAALACGGYSQTLSVQQASARGSAIALSLGVQLNVTQFPAVRTQRSILGIQQSPYFEVNDGDNLMRLNEAGQLIAYADLSRDKTRVGYSSLNRFTADESAWKHMENLVSKVAPPSGLFRSSLKRVGQVGGAPPLIRFTLLPRPFGYEAEGGNIISAAIRRTDGKLHSLYIGRGWTYEKPNIKISATQASKIASSALPGIATWHATLKYTTSPYSHAPAEIVKLNRAKTMRLCYYVASQQGTVVVDSVTGKVVAKGAAEKHPH